MSGRSFPWQSGCRLCWEWDCQSAFLKRLSPMRQFLQGTVKETFWLKVPFNILHQGGILYSVMQFLIYFDEKWDWLSKVRGHGQRHNLLLGFNSKCVTEQFLSVRSDGCFSTVKNSAQNFHSNENSDSASNSASKIVIWTYPYTGDWQQRAVGVATISAPL